MILRLEMILSGVFYERKNMIFYEKNLKLRKNNTFNSNIKNLKSFCGKKDAFDCAGIRAQVFRLPVDCSSNATN